MLDSEEENKHVDTECVTTANVCAGDAVGVGNRKWFVAIVNNNTEKSVQERLGKLGYESFVAKQSVMRVWKNGRKSMVDKVVIPSLVFVKCTEKERREIVTQPYINRFMTNRAAAQVEGFSKPLAVIPQNQMDTLRFMLGQSDVPVSFIDMPFKEQDKVVVIRGALKGVEGEVIHVSEGKSDVVVRIDLIGIAKMTIDSMDLERIKSNN